MHPTTKSMAETEWANNLGKRLEEWEKQLTGEGNKVSRPKIQEIPAYMAEKVEFHRYYRPQIISLGQFHRYEETGQGELYRNAWAAMYLKHANLKFEDICREIYGDRFWSSTFDGFDNDMVQDKVYNLIVDGCCVLELLEKSDLSVDPEQELKISMDKLVRVHQDLLILDNQIPFQSLRFFCEDQERLQKCLCNFLQVHIDNY